MYVWHENPVWEITLTNIARRTVLRLVEDSGYATGSQAKILVRTGVLYNSKSVMHASAWWQMPAVLLCCRCCCAS